ncbi:MAG: endonuclease/exonuclease/phosphatase family protein [Ruminococcaceae bacterium]|nr:endonuclease/exonuclease/phosphatase family protein [Oscillospiraceae bacterium]
MKIKVMTFNLRTDTPVDGINKFTERVDRVKEVIMNEDPDLIGFQEAKDSMREWLRNTLSDYCIFGCGRDKNYYGESTVIAVKKNKFEVISMDNFWLSTNTELPGSRFGIDQSNCPRITTCVRLCAKEISAPFWFYNTHLDHKGSTARLLGSTALMHDIALRTRGEKYVLTGDFNALPDTREIEFIVNAGAADATATLGGTFHGFGRLENKIKIDYIFTNADFDASESYVVEDNPVEGVYISDHNPVCGFIELN